MKVFTKNQLLTIVNSGVRKHQENYHQGEKNNANGHDNKNYSDKKWTF